MADDIKNLDSPQVIPIFRFRVNYAKDVGNELQYSRAILQYPFTIKEPIVYSTLTPFKAVYGLSFFNKAEEKAFLDFFYTQQGDAKKMWFASHVNAFSMVFPVTVPTFTIVVNHNAFDRVRLGHERFYILFTDGSLWTRKITGYSDNGDMTANLTFQDQLPVFDISLVVSCGFFHIGKFSSEKVRISYITTMISQCDVTLEELIQEYP